MPNGVKIIDRGFQKIIENLRHAGGSYVAVGVQGDDKREDSKATNSDVANWMEYGTVNVPERSFMRSTFDEQLPAIHELKAKLLNQVIAGKVTVKQGLGLIGAFLTGKIQAKISSNVPPPLAQSTIDAKGSSVSLIDTGQLRQSITWTVRNFDDNELAE